MENNEVLSLFHTFPPDDRVAILRNPSGRLSPSLVQRLSLLPGSVRSHAMFTSNPPNKTGIVLSNLFVEKLEAVRRHLDRWWENLDPEVHEHLIRHRGSGIDGHYKGAVMCAGDGKPDGLIVAIVQDEKTGKFMLPALIDSYVAMRAREAGGTVEPDWTESRKVSDLAGSKYMLRASDEPDSPWKLVEGKRYKAWNNAPACTTVTFEDGAERHFLNLDEEVEIGRPPPGSQLS